MKVYVALVSTPEYTASAPSFKSVHHSLDGAKRALYPNSPQFWNSFNESRYQNDTWNGPDGFGTIKLMEVLP